MHGCVCSKLKPVNGPRDKVSREDPDFIESVEKAFRVLQDFSTDDPVLTVSRAAELTGLTRDCAPDAADI